VLWALLAGIRSVASHEFLRIGHEQCDCEVMRWISKLPTPDFMTGEKGRGIEDDHNHERKRGCDAPLRRVELMLFIPGQCNASRSTFTAVQPLAH